MANDTTRAPRKAPKAAAPRRKATPRPAVIEGVVVGKAETVALSAAAAPPARDTITFQGRTMAVRMPNAEQIALWPRLADRLNNRAGDLDETPRDGETPAQARERVAQAAAKLYGRVLTLVTSVLTDQDDKDWVEDQIIAGDLTLAVADSDGQQSAADIISLAVQYFADKRGAAAPATGPQPKARRRA